MPNLSRIKKSSSVQAQKSNRNRKKRVEGTRKSYSIDALRWAVEAFKLNVPIRKVLDIYGVPRSTICDIAKHGFDFQKKSGPPLELSVAEEGIIKNCILYLAKRGFPVVMDFVVQIS